MNNLLCPYTTDAVAEIETNREHIVPDALGGPNAFALRASAQKNADYGSSIDSRLIHAPLVNFLAATLGVETRSGPSVMKQSGELVKEGASVDITFDKDSIKTKLRIPVIKNPLSGEVVAVRGFGKDARIQLARVRNRMRKKGRDVFVEKSELIGSKVKSRITFSQNEVAHGLGKIAYLMTAWTLGDAFVKTSGACQYRAWIEADPNEVALQATGLRVLPLKKVHEARPELPKHFHVLTCYRARNQVATTVQLFGEPLLGFGALVDTPELPPTGSLITIVAVNPLDKSFESRTFESEVAG